MQTEIETHYVKLWKEDGILCGAFRNNICIDLEIAMQCVSERIKFSNGVNYPCLFDIRSVKSANKQAREYFSSNGIMYVKAEALLTNSVVAEIMGTVFLKVNKRTVPTRIFIDETEAKKWLRQYL